MFSKARLCADLGEFMDARVVTFLNPYSYLKISEAGVPLDRFDKLCIDGVALKVALQLVVGDLTIDRLSFDFTSVAAPVFERAARDGGAGFILGADEASNTEFLARIRERFPGVRLSGRSGYFDSDDAQTDYLAELAVEPYDFIVVGMGAVRQEQAVIALLDHGFPGRLYTCGGFIHQTAMSGGDYYPGWVDRLNLRFAYRMVKEPQTVRRYLVDYPKALGLLVRHRARFRD